MARRIKADRRRGVKTPLDRIALVVARPLPYLYLAREVFSGAGIPYEALDTLPLAAEPYAAAVDVVLEAVSANFTRRSMMALLRSPHFRFQSRRRRCRSRVRGRTRHRDGGAALPRRPRSAARAGRDVDRRRTSRRACRARHRHDACTARRSPGRWSIRPGCCNRSSRPTTASTTIAAAAPARRWSRHSKDSSRHIGRHDPSATGTVTELSAAIRRWIGSQTFDVATTRGGVRILDAQSARFADLDDVQILGLVEGEWPERQRRNVFYPAIARGPARTVAARARRRRRGARSRSRRARGVSRSDRLAAARTRLSTFALESEAVVEPSTFLDDVPSFGLRTERDAADDDARVFEYEVLADDPSRRPARDGRRRARAQRRARPQALRRRGRAWVLPRVSVSRLERYMKCPFQFYVSNVLQVGGAT